MIKISIYTYYNKNMIYYKYYNYYDYYILFNKLYKTTQKYNIFIIIVQYILLP